MTKATATPLAKPAVADRVTTRATLALGNAASVSIMRKTSRQPGENAFDGLGPLKAPAAALVRRIRPMVQRVGSLGAGQGMSQRIRKRSSFSNKENYVDLLRSIPAAPFDPCAPVISIN